MSDSFRRFENIFRFLSTLTLSLIALGFLLIPNRLGSVTDGLSVVTLILLGWSFYIVGLLNQASIFVIHQKNNQQIVDFAVTVCLIILGFLYFQASHIIESIALTTMVGAQLYLLVYHAKDEETERNIFVLGYAALNLVSGSMLVFGLINTSAYAVLDLLKTPLGIVFIIGGLVGIISFYLSPKSIARVLSKFAAIPWMLGVIIFSLAARFNTVIVFFGFAILPLIIDLGSWNKLRLPSDDFIGRRVVRIASGTEFLMLISIFLIGHNSQGPLFQNSAFVESNLPISTQDFAFIAMFVAKGFSLYGIMLLVLTINRLRAELSNPDFDEKDYIKSPFSGWSRWISRSFNTFASPSRNLHTKIEIQAEQISSLGRQLDNERKRSAQLNLLAELSHQLEAQLDQPVAAQLAVNSLQRALDCKHVAVFENEIDHREFSIMASAGTFLPSGYRQSISKGLLGRTLRLRKTQIANDAALDPDFYKPETSLAKSIFAVPLIYHGHVFSAS